eukprot:3402316-Rhodomonas_salina.2
MHDSVTPGHMYCRMPEFSTPEYTRRQPTTEHSTSVHDVSTSAYDVSTSAYPAALPQDVRTAGYPTSAPQNACRAEHMPCEDRRKHAASAPKYPPRHNSSTHGTLHREAVSDDTSADTLDEGLMMVAMTTVGVMIC